jgi:hypothetical protein
LECGGKKGVERKCKEIYFFLSRAERMKLARKKEAAFLRKCAENKHFRVEVEEEKSGRRGFLDALLHYTMP